VHSLNTTQGHTISLPMQHFHAASSLQLYTRTLKSYKHLSSFHTTVLPTLQLQHLLVVTTGDRIIVQYSISHAKHFLFWKQKVLRQDCSIATYICVSESNPQIYSLIYPLPGKCLATL
jgi:hypothetical protein